MSQPNNTWSERLPGLQLLPSDPAIAVRGDGVVGEVIFPNTVPPFYPGFVLFAGPPKDDEYKYRRAGIHAHNRWLVDFCARKPAQRAGIGLLLAGDHLEQRRLAGAVRSDESHPGPAADVQRRVLEQDALAEGLGDAMEGERHVSQCSSRERPVGVGGTSALGERWSPTSGVIC